MPVLQDQQPDYDTLCLPSADHGAIPARTGEPILNRFDRARVSVYPRAYGGTSTGLGETSGETGLSPRVRGNLSYSVPHLHLIRSIPARTGEPLSSFGVRSRPTVYPRAYGGTVYWATAAGTEVGLSPRVRGNHDQSNSSASSSRSIPARTGEPRPVEFQRFQL